MKLLVLILNKVEMLEDILSEFAHADIKGSTILSSTGMAMALSDYGDIPFLGSLRAIIDPERTENKTVLTVLKEEQVPNAINLIEKILGDLSEPNTGIVFTLSIDFLKGICE